MKILTQKGFSFGLTSGIITTVGLMIGLFSSTQSKLVVIGGILTIAIADAFADSLSIHISEEAQAILSHKKIWVYTIIAFTAKFIFSLLFIIPILIFSLKIGLIINCVWGIAILTIHNILIAKKEKKKAWKVVFEHLSIFIIVMILTYFCGKVISYYFS